MEQTHLLYEAKQIISQTLYINLSTSSKDCLPWVSPVYSAYDSDFTFYWRSQFDALHSQNIAQNPNIAMVVYNTEAPFGTGKGVYFLAKASEITNTQEIASALKYLTKRVGIETPPAERYQGRSTRKVYKAIPYKCWVNGVEHVDGEILDKKIELSLAGLSSV